MSTDTATATAPAVEALHWEKGRHKGRAVQHLRTAAQHTLGVVITYPKMYRDSYPGEGYGAGCWEIPLYVDGEITTDPRRHSGHPTLAAAKAALLAAAWEVAADRINADQLAVQASRQQAYDRAADRRREIPLF